MSHQVTLKRAPVRLSFQNDFTPASCWLVKYQKIIQPDLYSQYRIVVLSCVASQDIAPLRLQQSGTRVANELQPQS